MPFNSSGGTSHSFLRRLSLLSCGVTVLICSAVILGWFTNNLALKSLGALHVPMNPVVATNFLIYSIAYAFLFLSDDRPSLRIAGKILASVGLAVAALKIISFFGPDAGVDQLLFRDVLDSEPGHQLNRMAPNTAFNFVLAGMSLVLWGARTKRGIFWQQLFVLLSLSIATMVLIGYGYTTKMFIQVASFLPMAFNTALSFLFLGQAIMCAQPDLPIMEAIASKNAGGVISRRLLPALILMPILFGWLRVIGEKNGLYDMEFGTAITIALMVVVSCALILSAARYLNMSDERLQQAVLEVRALNDALSEQNVRLQSVNEELEDFSSSVSHDLRAPLRAITGFSQMIKTDSADKLDDDAQALFDRVINASEKMNSLIESLLRLAGLTRQEMHPVEVDLSQIVDRTLREFRRMNPERPALFKVASDLKVVGDEKLLEVAVTNLLSNAWKYTSRKPETVIEFGLRDIEGRQAFYISDNGAGFDLAHADKLFGAFQRFHSERDYPGVGVGLATVRRIVHRHGGRVWAESSPGQGATFYFIL